MNKKTLELYFRLEATYDKAHKLSSELENYVSELCDFEAGVTYCMGDGVLVIEKNSGDTASFDCLKGKSKNNKLCIEEFNEYGV